MCYVGDSSDVWDEEMVRARKPHRCDECRTEIPTGVRYIRIGSLYEGQWETLRMHFECRVLWGAVHLDLCEGRGAMMVGGLDEELRNYEDEYGDEGARVLPYAQRFEAIREKYARAT
jgi:hypothetical protein